MKKILAIIFLSVIISCSKDEIKPKTTIDSTITVVDTSFSEPVKSSGAPTPPPPTCIK